MNYAILLGIGVDRTACGHTTAFERSIGPIKCTMNEHLDRNDRVEDTNTHSKGNIAFQWCSLERTSTLAALILLVPYCFVASPVMWLHDDALFELVWVDVGDRLLFEAVEFIIVGADAR